MEDKQELTSDNESCLYDEMVEGLANFVIIASNKDNPAPAELNAMVEVSKLLFKTL